LGTIWAEVKVKHKRENNENSIIMKWKRIAIFFSMIIMWGVSILNELKKM
jgi:hypothetical protein